MALARKPKAKPDTADEKSIEALINRGGSVAEDAPAAKTNGAGKGKTVNMTLRLPPDLSAQVDAAVEQRAIRPPRHTWILEAIYEKLDREASG
ncbi:MAG: hypothetical protein AAGB18_05770 [Pseudomonadota bacterium]